MRWAFVLQLGSDTQPLHRHFSGRIEEVDTGHELRFRSTDELLTFLGQCFEEASQRDRPGGGSTTPRESGGHDLPGN